MPEQPTNNPYAEFQQATPGNQPPIPAGAPSAPTAAPAAAPSPYAEFQSQYKDPAASPLSFGQAFKEQMLGPGTKDMPAYKVPVAATEQAVTGAGRGLLDTASSVGKIVHGGIGLVSPDLAEKVIPQAGLTAEEGYATPKTGAEQAGFAGEGLLEFIMGDEALKALPLSERLAQAGKVLKTLEKSPRLLEAIRMGARGAVTGAVQSVLHGASAEEALKAGGVTGAIGGAGGALIGTGAAVKEAAEAQKVLQEHAANAPSSSDIMDRLSETLQDGSKQMHQDFAGSIKDIQDRTEGITRPVADSPARQTAQEVMDKYYKGTPGEHPQVTQARQSLTEKIDPKVRSLVENIAKGEHAAPPGEILDTFPGQADPDAERLVKVNRFGEKTDLGVGTDPDSVTTKKGEGLFGVKANGDWEWRGGDQEPFTKPVAEGEEATPGDKVGDKVGGEFRAKTLRSPDYDVEQLINLRQTLAAEGRNYDYGDINARIIRETMEGIDDTIEELAGKAKDPSALKDYEDARSLYKTRVQAFDSPVIQQLKAGERSKAAESFLQGNAIVNYRKLVDAVGNEKAEQFGTEVYKHMLGKATRPDGSFSASVFLKQLNRVPEDIRNEMFRLNDLPLPFQDDRLLTQVLTSNAKTAKNFAYISKAIMGGTLAHFPKALLFMLGASYLEGGINKTAQVLDELANKPYVWKGLGLLGSGMEKAGGIVGSRAAQYAASREAGFSGPPQAQPQPSKEGMTNIPSPVPLPPADINSGRWVDAFQKANGAFDADKMADFITKFEGSEVGKNNPGALKIDGDMNPPRDAKGFARFSSTDKGRKALVDMLNRFASDPKMQELTPMEFINGKPGVYPGYSPDAAPENKNHPALTYAQSMVDYANKSQAAPQKAAPATTAPTAPPAVPKVISMLRQRQAPAGYTTIRASDGKLHHVPSHRIEEARKIDPKLQVLG